MPSNSYKPTDEELAAFAAGQLSEEHCARIESYLESHPESEQRWAEIVVDDQLLSNIRNCGQQPEPPANGGDRLPPDTTVGRYVIRAFLGQGGMGAVYKAHDPLVDREIALKILDGDKPATERAISEVRAQGSLSHSNIVPVYDAGHCEHGVFIAMELMQKSIEDVLRESGPQSVEDATKYLLSAIDGLQTAHKAGLIHRDIKPANLLLSTDGILKVADFGLAQTLDSETIAGHAKLAGTPHYMSPEQCRSDKVDVRSDVYALGATFYSLLTGEKPYSDSESVLQVMFAHCESAPPNLSAIRADLPVAFAKLIERAMAKRPSDRFANVEEFSAAIQSVNKTKGTQAFNTSDSSQVWRQLAAIPAGPSLLVLPFENLSGDASQDYFSDGITHEIVTQLGRFGELNLVAARTAFQYKGQSTDLQDLREQLGVRYVLEGTVRKSGDKLRISANLFNTESSGIFWTQSFDKDLSLQDVIAIQDEVAESVASALAQPYGQLHVAEGSHRHQGGRIDAYDAVLRFYEYWRVESLELFQRVRDELEEAVKVNPEYAHSSAALALLYVNGYRIHQVESGRDDLEKARQLAIRALTLDPNCEMAHQALMSVHFHRNDVEAFTAVCEKGLVSHPNHADLLADAGLFFTCLGRYERGVALAEKALALSPNPPGWYQAAGIIKDLHDEDFQGALSRTFKMEEGQFWTHIHRAVSLAHLGRVDEASDEVAKCIDIYPDLESRFREALAKFNVTDEIAHCHVEGLRLAGCEII